MGNWFMMLGFNLLNHTILGSTLESLPGYRHGDLSLNHPQAYAQMFLTMIR